MFKKSFFLLALLYVVVAERSYTILYERSGAPGISKWSLLQPAHDSVPVTFTLALKQSNLDVLERLFWDNSNPDSPNYAKHLTREQVRRIIEPPQWVQDAVYDWMFETAREHNMEEGLINIFNGGDYLQVTATAALTERLFQTKLWTFAHQDKGTLVVKHLGTFSIPTDLVEHIEMVTGITEFAPTDLPFLGKGVQKKVQQDDNDCNVPYNIKKLYGIPLTLNVTNPNANQSIYAEASYDQPEGFGVGSLSYWEQANDLPANPITCVLGNGKSDFFVNDTDAEAQLDTQMMSGFAPGAKTCFYIMEYGNAWMYEFSLTVFNTSNAPLVVSMSYGWWEAEQCINVTEGTDFLSNCSALHIPNSQAYVARTNIEFMKLGLVGHTLLAASGDDGTSGTHGTMDNCATMNPIFPAASPFVLTVGATSIEPESSSTSLGGSGGKPPICTNQDQYACECSTSTNEQACLANNTGGFDTGGGFSVFSTMPTYQTAAVTAYIKSGITLPSTQYWNPNNRGFPDVAAVGENICVLDPGTQCELLGGTSAATPMWGAIITLLNQDRLNAGKTPLGFINPLIYKMYGVSPSKFFNNQMSIGNNGGDCGPEQGFNAAVGWDPLTGCGSPKFGAIRKYVASLN